MKKWLHWIWRLIWQPRHDARLTLVHESVERAKGDVDDLRAAVISMGGKLDGN